MAGRVLLCFIGLFLTLSDSPEDKGGKERFP
jgi:hypothetical protein